MGLLNCINLILERIKFLELLLVHVKTWVVFDERFESILWSSCPKPAELGKSIKELGNTVFGSLNRSSEEKDDLYNLLISSNPVVEWLFLLFWSVLLEPQLNFLGGLKDMRSGSVNGDLDIIKRWLESRDWSIKVDIDLEEWLQDLFWSISSSADSLLHLVERVLGGVEESLVH